MWSKNLHDGDGRAAESKLYGNVTKAESKQAREKLRRAAVGRLD